MKCKKCGKELIGKQISYCSKRCSKLHLKKLYKIRNRERINEYNRNRRKLGVTTCGKELKKLKDCDHLRTSKCARCGKDTDLQVHHIKPRDCNGNNSPNNLILFCCDCHYEYEQLTKRFWRKSKSRVTPKIEVVVV